MPIVILFTFNYFYTSCLLDKGQFILRVLFFYKKGIFYLANLNICCIIMSSIINDRFFRNLNSKKIMGKGKKGEEHICSSSSVNCVG